MSRINKVVWALGVVCVSLFVLLTSRTNIRNFERVRDSIEAIYADRLVVNGLIYELSSLLHRKEVACLRGDDAFYQHVNESVDAQIDSLLREFRLTQLTRLEEKTLDRFTDGVAELRALEQGPGGPGSPALAPALDDQLEARFASLHGDLEILSRIQLSEGRRRVGVSDKAVDSMNTFVRIENAFLLVSVGLLVVLVFFVPGARVDRRSPGDR